MIREATPKDVSAIVAMVHGLALYERAPHECLLTDAQLHEALFCDKPALFGHVAQDDASGEVVGFALWFLNFSTWKGVHGIWLEDLFVKPEQRGKGHGKALLRTLAKVAHQRGYARVEWAVLDWNAPSIAFYESIGAKGLDEWTIFRLTGDALGAFATGA
jgi:GNAT superfamily N-acetyltransferase